MSNDLVANPIENSVVDIVSGKALEDTRKLRGFNYIRLLDRDHDDSQMFKVALIVEALVTFCPRYGDVFKMPIIYRIGAAMDFGSSESGHKLTITTEAVHPSDYTERILVGAEYTLFNMVVLRSGYRFNSDEKKYSAGAGVRLRTGGYQLQVDAAYTDFGLFEDVLRFTIRFDY